MAFQLNKSMVIKLLSVVALGSSVFLATDPTILTGEEEKITKDDIAEILIASGIVDRNVDEVQLIVAAKCGVYKHRVFTIGKTEYTITCNSVKSTVEEPTSDVGPELPTP